MNTGRTFDIRHCFADITRARTCLGFEPVVPFEEGMAELIEWARRDPSMAVDLFDQALGELRDKGLLAQ